MGFGCDYKRSSVCQKLFKSGYQTKMYKQMKELTLVVAVGWCAILKSVGLLVAFLQLPRTSLS